MVLGGQDLGSQDPLGRLLIGTHQLDVDPVTHIRQRAVRIDLDVIS